MLSSLGLSSQIYQPLSAVAKHSKSTLAFPNKEKPVDEKNPLKEPFFLKRNQFDCSFLESEKVLADFSTDFINSRRYKFFIWMKSYFTYYFFYFISTFCFDIISFSLILVLVFFEVNIIAFMIMYIFLKASFSGLDSMLSERTKIHFKKRAQKIVQAYKNECLKSKLAAQKQSMRRQNHFRVSICFINRLLASGDYLYVTESQMLNEVLSLKKRDRINSNEMLILLNLINVIVFNGRNMAEVCKDKSIMEIKCEIDFEAISTLERYILIFFCAQNYFLYESERETPDIGEDGYIGYEIFMEDVPIEDSTFEDEDEGDYDDDDDDDYVRISTCDHFLVITEKDFIVVKKGNEDTYRGFPQYVLIEEDDVFIIKKEKKGEPAFGDEYIVLEKEGKPVLTKKETGPNDMGQFLFVKHQENFHLIKRDGIPLQPEKFLSQAKKKSNEGRKQKIQEDYYFPLFLLQHHKSICAVENSLDIQYRSGVEEILKELILSSNLKKDMVIEQFKSLTGEGDLEAFRSLIHVISDTDYANFKQDIEGILEGCTFFTPFWVAYLKLLNGAPYKELELVYKDTTKSWSKKSKVSIWYAKKLVVDVIASSSDQEIRDKVIEMLKNELLITKVDPQETEEQDSFMLKILCSIVKDVRASGKDIREIKNIISSFLERSEVRCSFAFKKTVSFAKSLQASIIADGYSAPIFVNQERVEEKLGSEDKSKMAYHLGSRNKWYFSTLYSLSAAGLALTIIAIALVSSYLHGDFSSLFSEGGSIITLVASGALGGEIPPILMSGIVGVVSYGFLQVVKGFVRKKAMFYSIDGFPALKDPVVLAELKSLQKTLRSSSVPLFQVEFTIYEAYKRAFSVDTRTDRSWRVFYFAALKQGNFNQKLLVSLAQFILTLEGNPDLLDESESLKLHTLITDRIRKDVVAPEYAFHYYNVLSLKYVINVSKFIICNETKNDKFNITQFETDYFKLDKDIDILYRLKFFYFLFSLAQDVKITHESRARIFHHFFREIRYSSRYEDSKNMTLFKANTFILTTFLNSSNQKIWEIFFNGFLDYVSSKILSDGLFFMPVVRGMNVRYEKIKFLVDKYNYKERVPRNDAIRYIVKNLNCFKAKKVKWKYTLPKIFYRRCMGYSVLFLVVFSCAMITLDCTFRLCGFLSFDISEVTFAIRALILVNVISLLGRLLKDFLEKHFEQKVFLSDRLFYCFNIKKIKKREVYDKVSEILRSDGEVSRSSSIGLSSKPSSGDEVKLSRVQREGFHFSSKTVQAA